MGLLSTLRRDMLSVMSNPPSMLPQLSLHMLHQLLPMPIPTLLVCQSMLESTILASVKPKLIPNTSTTPEFTPTDTTDMPSQRSTTPLLPQESTTDFTTPMLESTPLASVKPKLTLNTYTTLTLDTHTLLDTPDTLDTPDSTDTPPHTPTATCGTDISTKNQYLICNMFLLKKFWQNLN